VEELPKKLDALAKRCEEAGRDRSTIQTSYLASVLLDPDGDKARAQMAEMLKARGIDRATASDEEWDQATSRFFVGSPDEVAEQIKARVLDAGVDGIIINMVSNGHVPGLVELAGKALAPLVN
jgi:alkanesulfonate monooxygenase SsuD/methylene tetrahydromethanopterin reductase-like flavin-dependent oxidoreductase (luciferase family)